MPQARSLHHLGIHHRIGGISPYQATKNQIGDTRQGRLKDTAVELERADLEWSGEVQKTQGMGTECGETGRLINPGCYLEMLVCETAKI